MENTKERLLTFTPLRGSVTKSILSKTVAISEPFFLFTRTTHAEPKSIALSPVSIRDLVGRPHTRAQVEARAKVPLSELALFTIEVKGRKLLVDTEGMAPAVRVCVCVCVCVCVHLKWRKLLVNTEGMGPAVRVISRACQACLRLAAGSCVSKMS